MLDLTAFSWLIAQGGDGGADPGGGFPMWPSLVAIMVLFYFMLIRPEKQKQRAHQSLIEAIKKNDRVVTVGGIYGVVTNVQREKDEVTVRVDESNGTKLVVTFGSIARVVTDDDKDENTRK